MADGTIELGLKSLGDLGKHAVLAVRCAGQADPQLELRLVDRPGPGAVVSEVDYVRLSVPSHAPAIEVRLLTYGEVARRVGARTTLPLLTAVAAVAAALAAFAPGPSEDTRRQRALAESVKPVAQPITRLERWPASGATRATRARRAVVDGRQRVIDARNALGNDTPTSSAPKVLTELAGAKRRLDTASQTLDLLVTDGRDRVGDAEVVEGWRSAASQAQPSERDPLGDYAPIVAAIAGIGAALLAFWKSIRT